MDPNCIPFATAAGKALGVLTPPGKEAQPAILFFDSVKVVDPVLKTPLSLPYPDCSHQESLLIGSSHRAATTMLPIDRNMGRRFLRFFRSYMKKMYKPINPEDVPSLETWLESRDINSQEKTVIIEAIKPILHKKDFAFSTFTKHEPYTKYYAAFRAIQALPPSVKAIFGPVFQAIENEVFSKPQFVKKIPVELRAAYIFAKFGDNLISPRDYTSMEAHHRGVYSRCFVMLISYLVQNLSYRAEVMGLLSRTYSRSNLCQFKHFAILTDARLMSGSLWTSLANGVLNDAIAVFLTLQTQFPDKRPEELAELESSVDRLIEGDDSLVQNSPVDPELIIEMGLSLKIEEPCHPFAASFCGIVSPDGLFNQTDPVKMILKTLVMDARKPLSGTKQLSLLRCKALSIKTMFPSCPVLTSFADYLLRHTRGTDYRFGKYCIAEWSRHHVERAVKNKVWNIHHEITENQRLFFAQRFGITVEQQLYAEKWFSTNALGDISFDWLINEFAEEYSAGHVRPKIGSASYAEFPLPDEISMNTLIENMSHPDLRRRMALLQRPLDVSNIVNNIKSRTLDEYREEVMLQSVNA